MAIVRVKQLRGMAGKELDSKLTELKLELTKEKGNVRMGKPTKNTGKIGGLRRAIAKVKTIQREAKNKPVIKTTEVKKK